MCVVDETEFPHSNWRGARQPALFTGVGDRDGFSTSQLDKMCGPDLTEFVGELLVCPSVTASLLSRLHLARLFENQT